MKEEDFSTLAVALAEVADKPKPVETVESIRAEMVDLFGAWVYLSHREDQNALCAEMVARTYRATAIGLRNRFNLPVRHPMDIERRRSSESENDYQARIRQAPKEGK